jgi:serine/threonine-protein kinase RsbW
MPRLVLIERDKEFAECLIRILSAEGFDVYCSDSVDSVIAEISGNNPDAVIVDLHDGTHFRPEHISLLKSGNSDLPIIVTAHFQTPDLACKALSVGASDFLLKPFGTREILDRVRKAVKVKGGNGHSKTIDDISSGVSLAGNLNDLLKICLDQLAGTLHLTDCLVALRQDGIFRVVAARGYSPDPVGRTLRLSPSTIEILRSDAPDNVDPATDGIHEIVSALSLSGHRPFPTLMPLESPSDGEDGLRGFILGHGALVLDPEDLLEMERFLSQVCRELSVIESGPDILFDIPCYEHEGEFRIPEIPRMGLVDAILAQIESYLVHENDNFWVRLALDEAISNAIIHGHDETLENPHQTVRVRFAAGPDRLMFVVEDTGDGFDYEHLPDPTADENLLNITGRGVYIMRKVMHEVVYNRKGNCVTMVRMLNGRPIKPFFESDDLAMSY